MNEVRRKVLRAFLDAQLDILRAKGLEEDSGAVTRDVEAFLADASPDAARLVGLLLDAIHVLSLGRFDDQTARQRRDWLHHFARHAPLPAQTRDLVAILASLGWLVIYARPAGRKLAWPHEPGPTLGAVDVPDPGPVDLTRPYEVCVIGSGAGGAVVAARLAEAGIGRVLLVEAGRWVSPKDFTARDDVALRRCYASAGVQPALSHAIPIEEFLDAGRVGVINVLQGAVVGGGPAVNNAICLRIPPPTGAQGEPWGAWRAADLPFTYAELSEAYRVIEEDLRLDPTTVDRVHGWRSALFGPNGKRWDRLPIAVSDCLGCGRCNTGCPYGRKTGGLHGRRDYGPLSHLERALAARVSVASRQRAERFELKGGRVGRVILRDEATGGRVAVHADAFVLAAGPIASTAVLRRTGLPPSLPLGRRAAANVVTPVYGVVPSPKPGPKDPGLQMCYFVGTAGKLLRETWFHYPGSIAVSLPGWFERHEERMRDYERLSCVGVVVPTGPHGRVGDGRLYLSLDRAEFRSMRSGLIDAANALFDVGATQVHLATKEPTSFDASQRPGLEDLLNAAVDEAADLNLATPHPQGGNAISNDPAIGVVDATFQVRGAPGLFVADASLFPAGAGVNPMLTTMALAHMAAASVQACL
ncbi:MAG: GMC oxidoreductase [Planctomycetes bacterium]|nr:GMC oxidoreductase [Planctomycetota bacterium]